MRGGRRREPVDELTGRIEGIPLTSDFRTYAFDASRIDASGKDVGRRVYWKLYAIENVLRVIVHSVLVVQVGPKWWTVAVDPTIQNKIQNLMGDYAKRPWHSTPGKHEIYYTFLGDLNRILTANSHLFQPLIPDIDQWIARIEQVRFPRNIVGHMNWLTPTDRTRIDVFFADVQHLVTHISAQLSSSGHSLSIP
jgi:hypothetical protein